MAQKPDGSAAKTERVTFTRPAAERIAKVVRAAEAGSRDALGLRFERVMASQPTVFRAATFTGAWNIGSNKVVTFTGGPTATATARNLTWPLSEPNPGQQTCLIGKSGTAWMLIVPALSVISCDDKASGQQLSTFLG